MDKVIKAKLTNVLRCEGQHILENETDKNTKVSKMNDIFNLQKILMYYDELEPMLIKFFNEKTKEERWKNNEDKKR